MDKYVLPEIIAPPSVENLVGPLQVPVYADFATKLVNWVIERVLTDFNRLEPWFLTKSSE